MRTGRVVGVVVFLAGAVGVAALLYYAPPGSVGRKLLAAAVFVLYALRVLTLDDEALHRRRLGPAPTVAGLWLVGAGMLETALLGWSGDDVSALALQTGMAVGMAVIGIGKVWVSLRRV